MQAPVNRTDFRRGSGLLRSIRSMARDGVPGTLKNAGDVNGFDHELILQFARTLDRSGISSVDNFLARPDQERFSGVGKLTIAYEITRFEQQAALMATTNEDDWYMYLWNRMAAGANTLADMRNNQLRIATFNDDRSLEFFLFEAAQNAFNVDADKAQAFVSDLQIVHVYGQVGAAVFAGTNGLARYKPLEHPGDISARADGIRIIPEGRRDDAPFQQVQAWFAWAVDICFIGFGFDEQNSERLALASIQDQKKANGLARASVYASLNNNEELSKHIDRIHGDSGLLEGDRRGWK